MPAATRRRPAILVAFILSLATIVACQPAAPPATVPPAATQAEAAFLAKINEFRRQNGLGELAYDPELTAASRNWSVTMASRGGLSHDPNPATGVTTQWALIGENVGKGGSVDSVFAALVASPSHRATMLEPRYGHVGVGVHIDGNGTIWTTHRYRAVK
jgi:uncharacterized protein YkwD